MSSQSATFCARLLEERNRLGFRQADLAEKAGVARTTYLNYETGERTATVPFLLGLMDAGVDVVYLLTGSRDVSQTSPEEGALLGHYRLLPSHQRAALVQLVQSLTIESGNRDKS